MSTESPLNRQTSQSIANNSNKKRKMNQQAQQHLEQDNYNHVHYKMQIRNITLKNFPQVSIQSLPNPNNNYNNNGYQVSNATPLQQNVESYITQVTRVLSDSNTLFSSGGDLLSQMKKLVSSQESYINARISNKKKFEKQQSKQQNKSSKAQVSSSNSLSFKKSSSKKENKKASKNSIQKQQQQQVNNLKSSENLQNSINNEESLENSFHQQSDTYTVVDQERHCNDQSYDSFESIDTQKLHQQKNLKLKQQYSNISEFASPIPSEWSVLSTQPLISSFCCLEEQRSNDLDSWFNDEIYEQKTKKKSCYDMKDPDFGNFDINAAIMC